MKSVETISQEIRDEINERSILYQKALDAINNKIVPIALSIVKSFSESIDNPFQITDLYIDHPGKYLRIFYGERPLVEGKMLKGPVLIFTPVLIFAITMSGGATMSGGIALSKRDGWISENEYPPLEILFNTPYDEVELENIVNLNILSFISASELGFNAKMLNYIPYVR